MLLVAGDLFPLYLAEAQRTQTNSRLWLVAIARLGFRNATYHPGRTVLCITLIASAAFIIVAVDSFRRSGTTATDRKSGTGGFPLLAESLLPVVHDANTPEGRESLNLNNSNDNAALTRRSTREPSRATRRRHELSESLSTSQPKDRRATRSVHSRKSFHVSEFSSYEQRGKRESVAAPQSSV